MSSVANKQAENFKQLDAVISRWKEEPGGLLPIMQEAQKICGCLDEQVQTYISKGTGQPVSTIYGIATFYSLFTLEAKGEHTISVCLGTACYVRGSQLLADELEKQLNIPVGSTTPDGKFSLDATRCIGCCGLAPAMVVDEKVYGRLAPKDIAGVLAELN